MKTFNEFLNHKRDQKRNLVHQQEADLMNWVVLDQEVKYQQRFTSPTNKFGQLANRCRHWSSGSLSESLLDALTWRSLHELAVLYDLQQIAMPKSIQERIQNAHIAESRVGKGIAGAMALKHLNRSVSDIRNDIKRNVSKVDKNIAKRSTYLLAQIKQAKKSNDPEKMLQTILTVLGIAFTGDRING